MFLHLLLRSSLRLLVDPWFGFLYPGLLSFRFSLPHEYSFGISELGALELLDDTETSVIIIAIITFMHGTIDDVWDDEQT